MSGPADALLRQRLGITQLEAEELVERLRRVGLGALVQEIDGTVRCIQAGGLSDNEAGLLFLAPTSHRPMQDQELPDGRQLVVLEELTPTLLFYISS